MGGSSGSTGRFKEAEAPPGPDDSDFVNDSDLALDFSWDNDDSNSHDDFY